MDPLVIGAASHSAGAIIIGLIVLLLIFIGIGTVLYLSARGAKKVVDSATHHDQQPGHS
ncbi:MAG TPA: hypothetical protein VME01_06910 [Solirubrobacteraceae bacterium]|nr:hypothetical protein [Solirubrobacteraceae bacterium]